MRESVPGQASSTVQLNLYTTKPARLLSVNSPVARSGEIQVARKHHGRMQTQTVGSLELQARNNVVFGTGGVYLVLEGLKQPLNAGDRVPLTLVVEMSGKKQTVQVEAEVRRLELSYQHYKDPNVKDHR